MNHFCLKRTRKLWKNKLYRKWSGRIHPLLLKIDKVNHVTVEQSNCQWMIFKQLGTMEVLKAKPKKEKTSYV